MINEAEKIFRKYFPKRLKNRTIYQTLLKGLNGVEIGGPSQIFSVEGLLPVYDIINSLDGINFSNETVWEGKIKEGANYKFGNKIGHQFVKDSVDLSSIDSEKYDFLLSCHSLEHIANPIKALTEWKRVIKKDGFLVLILPHKDKTFDHKRPVTTLKHLIDDYEQNVLESDNTHFEEVLQLHDLELDQGINSIEELNERVKSNYLNRCLHHHVFNTHLTAEILDYSHLQILDMSVMYHNIFSICKRSEYTADLNSLFLSSENLVFKDRNYPSDFNTNSIE